MSVYSRDSAGSHLASSIMTRRSYRRDIQPYRIHVQKQDGSHCTFRIKPYVRLTKRIKKLCKAANNNIKMAKFCFDGMKV